MLHVYEYVRATYIMVATHLPLVASDSVLGKKTKTLQVMYRHKFYCVINLLIV